MNTLFKNLTLKVFTLALLSIAFLGASSSLMAAGLMIEIQDTQKRF